ncbi:MAG: hypothetical protein ACFFEO_00190 [Candidatus Thorarchaeota archaeon]
MEHRNLSLDYDKNLLDKILDDIDMRYIILFLYIIRNDLFKDLGDKSLVESYERVLILDDLYKSNILKFWPKDFTEIAIDLGLFKNIRTLREFDQNEEDFIIKLGEQTITLENNVISVPDDTLFLILNKKFKSVSRRNFNSALIKLKAVRCESTNAIHSLIYEISDHDYALSDDLYYILDQYGNIYQAIKIEITIEGFFQRFKEIQDNITKLINIFEPKLNKKPVISKIHKAIEDSKDIFDYLKENNIELPEKFNFEKIDTKNETFQQWKSTLLDLLEISFNLNSIEKNLLVNKKLYSGKGKKYSYLTFIEKVSYNEGNIVNEIQDSLLNLREELVRINKRISKLSKKEVKLLNLDYERAIIMSSDE